MTDTIITLDDLKRDPDNARLHSQRGLDTLIHSIREVGVARSGVIDEDGRILAGNLTSEALMEAGVERVRIVETDGKEWVVVKRSGLTEEQKTKLALYDNRISEFSDWDPEVLTNLLTEDDEILEDLWYEDELTRLLGNEAPDFNWEDEWKNMPEFEQKDILGNTREITIHFATSDDIQDFAELIGQSITEKTRYIWFPKQDQLNMKEYRCEDES